ncbi:Serine/threonine-protein phosphatase 5 [Dendrobium catenatum]|uniref:Serine/threonine-protein phosphatase 5 n=1 Tax=Dendrobium catenatum TaxID=906689 RepID=A0A2I0WRH2_9ASPA|nr:Serine/threonine-protein phosphatase 5 [Dendrobium catenatum]
MGSIDGSSNVNMDRAEETKILANEASKAIIFSQAIDLYNQAINLNGYIVYWANRAFAHTKLVEYGSEVLVVHGGLFSVDGVKLSDIRAIDRFCEPLRKV